MEHLYEIRKDLHRIPELAFRERKTTEYILAKLREMEGLKIHTFPFTGLLAEYTQGEGDYLLFRADMDGLPLEEKTECDFRSEHPGFMHACGHDIHVTTLIGLIEYVISKGLKRNILFLFQPAEEGLGGAERVLSTGILDRFNIREAYALHVDPAYPSNTIASREGVLMGIPQEFDVIFRGKSAHAAHPQEGRDALAAACSFSSLLYQSIGKLLSPIESSLCHIGKIGGGNARNIIAENCSVEGTLRALSRENMNKIKEQTVEVANIAAALYGAEPEVKFLNTCDPVVNSENLFEKLQKTIVPGIRLERCEPSLGGEDFGFFTTRYEGLLFWVGGNTPGIDLHSPYFLPDEKAIDTGLKTFIALLESDY